MHRKRKSRGSSVPNVQLENTVSLQEYWALNTQTKTVSTASIDQSLPLPPSAAAVAPASRPSPAAAVAPAFRPPPAATVVPASISVNTPFKSLGRLVQWEPVRNWFKALRKTSSSVMAQRPLVLQGPPGSGKTFAVNALANEYGLSIYVPQDQADSKSFAFDIIDVKRSFNPTIVLVDDADGLDAKSVNALVPHLTRKAAWNVPVVVVCNDYWVQALRSLHAHISPKAGVVTIGKVPVGELLKLGCRLKDKWVTEEDETLHAVSAAEITRLANDVNGDARQLQLRMLLGEQATTRMDNTSMQQMTMWDLARCLLTRPRKTPQLHEERANALAASSATLATFFEAHCNAGNSVDDMSRSADAFSMTFSAPSCHKLSHIPSEEAYHVLANCMRQPTVQRVEMRSKKFVAADTCNSATVSVSVAALKHGEKRNRVALQSVDEHCIKLMSKAEYAEYVQKSFNNAR